MSNIFTKDYFLDLANKFGLQISNSGISKASLHFHPATYSLSFHAADIYRPASISVRKKLPNGMGFGLIKDKFKNNLKDYILVGYTFYTFIKEIPTQLCVAFRYDNIKDIMLTEVGFGIKVKFAVSEVYDDPILFEMVKDFIYGGKRKEKEKSLQFLDYIQDKGGKLAKILS